MRGTVPIGGYLDTRMNTKGNGERGKAELTNPKKSFRNAGPIVPFFTGVGSRGRKTSCSTR